MSLLDVSAVALLIALFAYCFAFLGYVLSIAGRKWSNRDPKGHTSRWGKMSFGLTTVGLASHMVYFFTRWAGGGHIPVSNMYEFMTFLGMMVIVAFVVVYLIYRTPALGIFALPVAVILVAYASVFPQEVQPLIPALDSYWLKIHVTTAALGEAFFAVGFAAGLMYLLRATDFMSKTKQARKAQRGIELVLLIVIIVIAFISGVFGFKAAGYHAEFSKQNITVNKDTKEEVVTKETVRYILPPIVKPYKGEVISVEPFLGMKEPLFEAPSWMKGVNAGRKLNTVIWSLILGLLLYGILRLIARKPLGRAIHPLLDGIDPEDLDEISYRANAIGFPIFTLGALIFAMIWAHQAWSRFWGWDPKEVWALITWLFYTAYLHLRLSKGWQGSKSSWLAVIGFIVVMFTLVGVNLVIAGLHSYSGV
ncbi:cytochrome C biogenesis protein [Paenibacillus swuensis]|uniref:Cytochrome C biogenesis protein n=1 Tax=Paenibacillus swuensis TaxID=1178515 RepID=A0A172TLY7_9BACL|nr:cytochrome c biogenesis protein CcsA [Paenibacillus swuensis]ANE48002.1 cytochrome C biogenesis protein [Paenibacillus swuensis]